MPALNPPHTQQLTLITPPARSDNAQPTGELIDNPQPSLIRGQTSAHRGLRTFAQDRLRTRRDESARSHVETDLDGVNIDQ